MPRVKRLGNVARLFLSHHRESIFPMIEAVPLD